MPIYEDVLQRGRGRYQAARRPPLEKLTLPDRDDEAVFLAAPPTPWRSVRMPAPGGLNEDGATQ